MIRRQEAKRRLPAHPGQHARDLVEHGGGRRRAILRIERRDQYAIAASVLQRGEPFSDGRRAIAHRVIDDDAAAERACQRSEEHTSELQSLMRISYAVFCLKKKTYNNTIKAHKCTLTTQ